MTVVEVHLPDVGEGLVEADICRWLVAPGDEVALNEIVVEVETAKAVVELPSPAAGTVVALNYEAGHTAAVGSVLLTLARDGAGDPDAPSQPGQHGPAPALDRRTPTDDHRVDERTAADTPTVEVLVGYGPSSPKRRRARKVDPAVAAQPAQPAQPVAPSTQPVEPAGEPPPVQQSTRRARAKPKVRRLARDLGLDLGAVAPLENGAVVTEADVLRHATGRTSSPAGKRRVHVQGVRRAIAAAVTRSAFTAPHVTEFLTVDVSETLALVEVLRADRRFEGVRATPLLVAARAVCLAAQEFPDVNASWDEAAQEIVVHGAVNLGIAAATPRGLIVPNIKGAESLNLLGLAQSLAELVGVARAGTTTIADMSGGTMTITNVGVFGVDAATPILNPGESVILGLGAIRRTPWVVGDDVVPRPTMTLSLSFDHRLIDGELGSRFLSRIGDVLTHPTLELSLS